MMMKHTYRLRPDWRGAAYYTAFWSAMGTFAPFVNVYFANLGLSGVEIGLLSTLVPLMTLTVGPVLSALADDHARRRLMLRFTLVGAGLALFLEGLPDDFGVLAVVVAILAFFHSPVMSIADSLIARMAVHHQLDFGRMRMWGSFGFAGMAVGSGWLWQQFGLRWMFVTGALLFIPIFVLVGQLEEGPPKDKHRRQPFRKLLDDHGLLAILVASFMVGVGLQVTFIFGSIYMNVLGGGLFLVGLLSGLAAGFEIPAMRYSGALSERFGFAKTLIASYVLLGAPLLGYAVATSPVALLVASSIRGAGYGLFLVNTVRLIDSRVPQEWSSTAQSMMYAAMMGLAPLLTSPVAGWIYDTLGPVALFAGGGMIVGLAGVVIMIAAGRGMLN